MNESKPQPVAGSAAVAALESRIDRIRQSLATQQARLARGSRLTAIIGSGLIVLMAVYFSWFYIYIQPLMTPKAIVQAAESTVVEVLPKARKALETKINESAGDWAAELSTRVQEDIPKLRGQVEDLIMNQTGKHLDDMHVLTDRQFRNFIHENRDRLNDGFASLKKREDADQFVADLHTLIAKNMSGDMREQAAETLHTLYDLNHKLTVLKEGKNLKGDQAIEREILMIAKRLQRDSAEDRPDTPRKKFRSGRQMDDADDPAEAKPAGDAGEPAKEQPKSDAKDAPPVEEESKSGDGEAK